MFLPQLYPQKFKEDLKARDMVTKPLFASFLRPAIHFTYLLRMAEYFLGRADPISRTLGRYYRFSARRYGAKYGVTIPVNTCPGPGLFIMHCGSIVVNGNARIGRNCRIHAGVNIGQNRTGVPRIGDDVYIGPGAKLFGDIEIGDGVQIGANSVVSRSVPAGSIISGPYARIIYSSGKEDLDNVQTNVNEGNPALSATREQIFSIMNREISELSPEALGQSFDKVGIDSFSLMSLRSALETGLGTEIPDAHWGRVRTLEDILSLALISNDELPTQPQPSYSFPCDQENGAQQHVAIGKLSRTYLIGMPQMALSGLGEPWLFKEAGDLHWSMLSNFLESASSQIVDDAGNRLYATFARVKMEVEGTLRSFGENDPIKLDGQLSRFGANIFFSSQRLIGERASVSVNAMSSFAMYTTAGDNTSLTRGSPSLPNPDTLQSLNTLPTFALDYKKQRENNDSRVIFQTDYDIMPPHDINGVGLVYFAAYPSIFDICIQRNEEKGFLASSSVQLRDVCYLSNARPDDVLSVVVHDRQEDGDNIKHKGSIFRSSDMKRMAMITCVRKRLV